MDDLDPREEKFALEFARTGNASAAARVAGYSVRAAGQQGYVLLKRAQVLARITEAQAEWHAQQVAALREHVGPAIQTLAEIAAGNAEPKGAQARVLACTAILDRAGFQPLSPRDIAGSSAQAAVIINLSADDLAL